jgi:hypothetical protein
MFSSPLPLGKDIIIAVGSDVVQVPDSEFNGEEEGRCRELNSGCPIRRYYQPCGF